MTLRIQTQKELTHLVLLNTEGAPCLGAFTRCVDIARSPKKETRLPSQAGGYKQSLHEALLFLPIEKRST
jgi:hypothetical protein